MLICRDLLPHIPTHTTLLSTQSPHPITCSSCAPTMTGRDERCSIEGKSGPLLPDLLKDRPGRFHRDCISPCHLPCAGFSGTPRASPQMAVSMAALQTCTSHHTQAGTTEIPRSQSLKVSLTFQHKTSGAEATGPFLDLGTNG